MSDNKKNAEMFSSIAKRYDFLNHFLSFNIDKGWRKKVVHAANPKADCKILDLCTGTGDLAIEFAKNNPDQRITAIDLSEPMLAIAKRKAKKKGLEKTIEFINTDVMDSGFDNESFDIITIAFGLRNLSDREKAIAEMTRILKPSGRLFILELCPPPKNLFGKLYRFYLQKIIPLAGAVIHRSKSAYSYLASSVTIFLKPEQVLRIMQNQGLKNCKYEKLTAGIACIFQGQK